MNLELDNLALDISRLASSGSLRATSSTDQQCRRQK
jgi:hypothetical protein